MPNMTTEEHTKEHSDKVKYYRELNPAEIVDINLIKQKATEFMDLINEVSDRMATNECGHTRPMDLRWKAKGVTACQEASMFAVRAIAQPSGA